jgi:hypothetical protein
MHVSLDSALGRQRRLNSVGESVLQIAPNAAAAYSLRSLTGGDPDVVRVRIGGTTTEKTFTASGVSSGALVDFVGSGNDGFVTIWYDQSGNGNDAEQPTASNQPKIVISGSLIGNGIHFDGSGDLLNLPHPLISNVNSASLFVVATNEATGFKFIPLVGVTLSTTGGSTFQMPFYFLASIFVAYSSTSITLSTADTNKHLFTAVAGSSNVEGFQDGTSKGTLDAVSGYNEPPPGGLGGDATGTWNGKLEEIIIYASDQSDNRVALEANIQAAYPTLP